VGIGVLEKKSKDDTSEKISSIVGTLSADSTLINLYPQLRIQKMINVLKLQDVNALFPVLTFDAPDFACQNLVTIFFDCGVKHVYPGWLHSSGTAEIFISNNVINITQSKYEISRLRIQVIII